MINIKEKVHVSTTVVSLDRILRKSEIYGELKVDDLYILITIYSLLNTMCLDLSNKQRKNLISYYNKFAFRSKDVCTNIMLDAFEQPMKSKFSSKFVDESEIHKNLSVNYWKAEFTQSKEEVLELISKPFLESKLLASRESMSTGIDFQLNGIGRLCFFVNTLDNTNITIKDVLNNDVTESFDLFYDSDLNGVLAVSKEMYTSEPMNLKIIVNE